MADNIKVESEQELSIREYFDIFFKRRLIFAITVLVVFSVQVFFIMRKPFVYEASARVLIGPSTIQVKSLTGNMVTQRYEAQNELELMKSDTVIKRATILIQKESRGAYVISSGEVKGSLYLDASRDKSGYMNNIIRISARNTDPRKALTIVECIIKAYEDENEEYRKRIIDEAYGSAMNQLALRRKELEETEQRLTKYVLEHDILVRGVELGTDARQSSIAGKVGDAKTEEPRIDEKYLILKSQRLNKEAFLTDIERHREKDEVAALSIIAKREEKLVDLTMRDTLYEKERNLSKLLLTQSELHPNVIEAQGEVGDARKRISEEVEKAIQSLSRDVDTLKREEEKLYSLIKEGLSDTMIEYASLKRDIDAKRETYNTFIKQLQAFDLATQYNAARPIKVLEVPNAPRKPINPRQRNVVQAFIIAAFVGAVVVIFVENLDVSIKNVEDIEDNFGLMVLATIPFWKKKTLDGYLGSYSILNPKSVMSEAFRTLRTNIKFVSLDKKIKSLIVTSVAPSEGKSTIACNLASIIAMGGERVVLIDGDLRRAVIHKHFNLPNTQGLSDLLVDEGALGEIKVHDTALKTLKVITAGPLPPNPSELLGSEKMSKLIKKLEEEYDVVLIDLSPALTVTDSLIISAKVDGVILVFCANKTAKKAGSRVCQLFRNASANLMGAILNKVEMKGAGYYGGYYYSHYGDGYYGDEAK